MRVASLPPLPAIRFQTASPPLSEVLPRMDVAAMVGFASSGPLHTPVVVEDAQGFHSIFGNDLLLARDGREGQMLHAHLGPAVRSFFRNGGRRCVVIRVAERVPSASFLLPGVVRLDGDTLVAGEMVARSQGTWADEIRVSTALQAHALQATAYRAPTSADRTHALTLRLGRTEAMAPGDLLRLRFGDDALLMLVVDAVDDVEGTDRRGMLRTVAVRGHLGVWLQSVAPPTATTSATLLCRGSSRRAVQVSDLHSVHEEAFALEVVGPADELTESSVLDLRIGGQSFVFRSHDAELLAQGGTPTSSRFRLTGRLWAWSPASRLNPVAGTPSAVEELMLTVITRTRECSSLVLDRLGFAAPSPQFWAALPADEEIYRALAPNPRPLETPWRNVIERVSNPRFPLAGARPDGGFSFPLALDAIEGPSVAAQLETDLNGVVRSSLAREGLDRLDPSLFLDMGSSAQSDRGLATELLTTLMARADELRFLSRQPRDLAGIHAALPVDEVTMIAVPDAVHVGWSEVVTAPPEPPRPEPPPSEGAPSTFQPCAQLAAPTLVFADELTPPDRAGSFVLRWRLDTPSWAFRLEESTSPDFSNALTVYLDRELRFRTPARPNGVYYYRVRVEAGVFVGPWSAGLLSIVGPQPSAPPPTGPEPASEADVLPRLAFVEEHLAADETGSALIDWAFADSQWVFHLEEATLPDFRDAVVLYEGGARELSVFGRPPGTYYYRVRLDIGTFGGAFSPGILRVVHRTEWVAQNLTDLPESGKLTVRNRLLAVHRSLLRMCAARGDLLALLSFPKEYREAEVIDYLDQLAWSGPLGETTPSVDRVPALTQAELVALSFGAAQHPWLAGRDEGRNGDVLVEPPDGAVAGMHADRAIRRGVWIASANQPLQGVVSLVPMLPDDGVTALWAAGINLLRQQPTGFVTLRADTLSADPELQHIHVRRLLCLLRRIALRDGTAYVFEPNDDVFRRMVERGFEQTLSDLFARGAFAGRTRAEAYQVDVGSTVNPAASIEAGRLVVDLRVAPSSPLTFITVRLVQTDDRTLVSELR